MMVNTHSSKLTVMENPPFLMVFTGKDRDFPWLCSFFTDPVDDLRVAPKDEGMSLGGGGSLDGVLEGFIWERLLL